MALTKIIFHVETESEFVFRYKPWLMCALNVYDE